jgi:aminopeptidase YwaD
MRKSALPFVGVLALLTLGAAPSGPGTLPPAMAAYQRFAGVNFDGERARDVVAFVERYFRVPGNEGFDASLDRVVQELRASGYREEGTADAGRLTYRIEHRPMDRLTWEPSAGSLTLAGDDAPLLTYVGNRNLIAINSFPTPAEGVEAEVVDVGRGRPEDFEGKDVKGRIVFGETSVGRLFAEAVQKRGAAGVLAYRIPAFNHPEDHLDVISFSSIAQDTTARSWGLLLSTRARDTLKARLARGAVRARVAVDTRLWASDESTLVAEIRGASEPDTRFVFSAHVQEPGANDNATGVATLSEIARVLAEGVTDGVYDPARTLTMIWGDEISSTSRYMQEDSVRAKGVRWGLSLDMTGEDTEKTGGTFLIEKMPDPSAVWTRGDDHHTEWGGRPLTVDALTPHYLNDFVLHRCLDRAADTGWVVRTNPFEGGSDHVPFLRAGVAGVLFWHFTDVYYHTDGDRLEMVSSGEMANVGVCAAVSAMTLTTADATVASYLVGEVEQAALDRLTTEEALSREAVAQGKNVAEERTIVQTWASWYDGALASMDDIEVGGSSDAVRRRIADARAEVAQQGSEAAAAIR